MPRQPVRYSSSSSAGNNEPLHRRGGVHASDSALPAGILDEALDLDDVLAGVRGGEDACNLLDPEGGRGLRHLLLSGGQRQLFGMAEKCGAPAEHGMAAIN